MAALTTYIVILLAFAIYTFTMYVSNMLSDCVAFVQTVWDGVFFPFHAFLGFMDTVDRRMTHLMTNFVTEK